MGNICKGEENLDFYTELYTNKNHLHKHTIKNAKEINQLLTSRSKSLKKYNEIPIDNSFEEEKSNNLKKSKKTKNFINPMMSFEEDFKEKDNNDNPVQSSLRMSNELIKNRRMIFKVYYTNTKISKKLFINEKEIFITYNTVDSLDLNDVIYDCKMDKYFMDWRNEIYLKIYSSFLIILNMNTNENNTEKIFLDDIKRISNPFKKDKKDGIYQSGFKLTLSDNKEFLYKSRHPEIGKAAFNIIEFLIWKINYDDKNARNSYLYASYNRNSV